MRRLVSIASICAFATLAGVQSGMAEITYPWCAQYSNQHGGRNCGYATLDPWCARYAEQDRTRECSPLNPAQCRVLVSGTLNCGFVSLDQCRLALSGNGGSCEANPLYTPRAR